MKSYRMLIMSRPTEGMEAAYNDWYDDVHLGQMRTLPGIRSAQRLRLAHVLGQREAYPYAAIYEIETDDLEGVMRELYRVAGNGQLLIDPALDRSSIYAAVYETMEPARAA